MTASATPAVTVIGAISSLNLPASERGAGLLLAGCAVFVHALAPDAVALGDLLGGLQHVPVDLGLVS